MISFPTTFADNTQPLPELLTAADDLIQHLAAKGYEIELGLTPELAQQINTVAQQSSIKEYCPRDSSDRFKDRDSTEKWLKKGRATFLLFTNDRERRLAGYGWSGREISTQVPEGETTFALRISETDQGLGLATPFAQLILRATEKLYGAPHVWLETWASNGGAVHTYHKLDFTEVAQVPGNRPTPNGQTVPDTRLYMTDGQSTAGL